MSRLNHDNLEQANCYDLKSEELIIEDEPTEISESSPTKDEVSLVFKR